ncbi:MAG TPA: D-alanyl-D-alanine carboxypeptidase/D-alanyl-D-alanine-endopeptidase, partial [Arenicellales bacterium]|nr:D-alanyl-D-alanine carboxypeptidase/D-alanyl-D-alanine-endopeptidase [Arenicellales bacterium]
MSKSLFTCIFFAFYANLAGAALPSELDSLLDDYPVPRGRIGLYIAPAGGGQAVSLNPSRPFNPASTIKLLPSLAALEILSPAYQWHTRVYTTGEISGGVLNGDLYMLGGGDPYLTAEALWALLKDVRAQGIERIAGDIIVDNGVYRPVDFDRAAFDDKPDRLYNGPADGLMINFWGVRFTVRANAERIHIDAFPGSRQLEVVNRVRHSEAPCSRAHRRVRYRVESSPERVAVVFSGVLSRRCRPVVINRAVIPVDRYAGYVLPGLWRDAGGVLDGSVRNGRVPEEAELLVSRPSRSLAEVVRATNKFSNNMMARHLLLTLGSVRKERGIA